jgi:hypothetical protein
MFKKLKLRKIVNITSAHSRHDTRIYNKICKSLSKYYSVTLICADGKGSVLDKKISIIDLGSFKNRTVRFLSFLKIFKKALKINGDLYHLHDPDLILVGLLLIAKGKKVIAALCGNWRWVIGDLLFESKSGRIYTELFEEVERLKFIFTESPSFIPWGPDRLTVTKPLECAQESMSMAILSLTNPRETTGILKASKSIDRFRVDD